MELKELTEQQFNDYKDNCGLSSIYQSTNYYKVMNKENYDSILIGLVDNNNILAASLILISKSKIKYAYAPRGFIIDYNNLNLLNTFTTLIKEYLNNKKVVSIKICPPIIKNTTDFKYNINNYNNYYDNIFYNLTEAGYKHLGYSNYFEGLKPRFEAIIDLSVPYYILFKNIDKKYRTKIRSAENKGITVYKGDDTNINFLFDQIKEKNPKKVNYFTNMFNEFGKDALYFYTKLDTKHYLDYLQKKLSVQETYCSYINTTVSSKNKFSIRNTERKMNADKELNRLKRALVRATKLLKDYPDGIITSAALVLIDKNEAYLLTNGQDKKYKDFNSNNLLIWKIMEYTSKLGLKRLNLGGMTNPNQKKYKGLNDFRIKYNALCHEYIGDLELICNNTKYFIYRKSPIKDILKK